MAFTEGWNVTAGEAPTEAKWDQLGENMDYLYRNAVPTGVILLWSGSIATIPTGFAICDGANGTPDLRGRFVVGAGDTYAVGDNGGLASVTLGTSEIPVHSHGVTQSNHAHGISDGGHSHGAGSDSQGSHSHLVKISGSNNSNFYSECVRGGMTLSGVQWSYWGATNDNGAHSHNIWTNSAGANVGVNGATANVSINNAGGGASHENRPPYYALAYIMKL